MSTARGLYTFVNHRYVRDRGLNFAVQRGFHESLPGGRQPMAAIFVDLDPAAVDVNVHPQKLEVRFADGRGVTDAVFTAISRALGSRLGARSSALGASGGTPQYAQAVERFLARATEAAWGGPLPLPSAQERTGESYGGPRLGFGMARPDINSAPPEGFFANLRWLGTLGKRFWVCEGTDGTLVVLDAHAAWERHHLSTFLEGIAELGENRGQPTLFSRTVTLEPAELRRLGPALESLRALGIEAEPFGGREVALKSMPLAVQAAAPERLLPELLAVLPPDERLDGRWLPACRVLACHAATLSAQSSASHDSLRGLFSRLDDLDFSVDPQHPIVVVQQTPLLDLVGRADVKRSVS
jgi:DNA mismatch repair protein MutL